MKPFFTRVCLAAIFCSLAGIALAHTGSIRGLISDSSNGKPLEGASIFIKAAATSAVTDAFGKFFLKNIEPGRYKITITHIGYEISEGEFKVEDGVTTELAFDLVPANVKLEAVSINAKRDLQCISGLDLKLRPVNTTQDLLRLVPGLFTAQHQGGGKAEQIFLRGFDCDHGTDVNVSVDNMPVNMVSHAHGQGFADTHFIIPESVKELDYGKGPYQIDKGNLCTAGFVAFKTRNALDNSFVKVDGGMYGYFRTVAGLNLLSKSQAENGHQDAYIMGEYGYNRGYFDMPQNFNRLNLIGKYSNYLSANKMLTFTLSGFNSFWNASGQLPTRAIAERITSRYGGIDPESGNTGRYNFNVQYLQSINSNSYFKSNIFAAYYTFRLYSDFTYFLNYPEQGDQIRQAEERAMTGYNSEYNTNYTLAGLKMTTQAGIGLRYDNIVDDELSHTINRSATLDQLELGDVYETNISGYVNQRVFLTPQLVLSAGTRYDYFIQQYNNKLMQDHPTSVFSKGQFSPKAGIYYNFGNNARVYYNYGTGFHTNDTRTLALGEQMGSSVIINHTIPLAFSHDLGIIIKPYSKLLLSAALWRLDLQQEYSYVGDVAVIDTSGRTRRYGLDLSARYEVLKWLYLDVDINYAHCRSIDQPAGENYIPLAPAFTSVGGLTFRVNKNLVAGFRYRHMSDRPADETNSLTALGYTVCDAVVNYSRQHYEFGMQIQNLFNVQWNEAQFATETRLKYTDGTLEPSSQADVCFTPGTPFFIKLSATYKF